MGSGRGSGALRSLSATLPALEAGGLGRSPSRATPPRTPGSATHSSSPGSQDRTRAAEVRSVGPARERDRLPGTGGGVEVASGWLQGSDGYDHTSAASLERSARHTAASVLRPGRSGGDIRMVTRSSDPQQSAPPGDRAAVSRSQRRHRTLLRQDGYRNRQDRRNGDGHRLANAERGPWR